MSKLQDYCQKILIDNKDKDLIKLALQNNIEELKVIIKIEKDKVREGA